MHLRWNQSRPSVSWFKVRHFSKGKPGKQNYVFSLLKISNTSNELLSGRQHGRGGGCSMVTNIPKTRAAKNLLMNVESLTLIYSSTHLIYGSEALCMYKFYHITESYDDLHWTKQGTRSVWFVRDYCPVQFSDSCSVSSS